MPCRFSPSALKASRSKCRASDQIERQQAQARAREICGYTDLRRPMTYPESVNKGVPDGVPPDRSMRCRRPGEGAPEPPGNRGPGDYEHKPGDYHVAIHSPSGL